MEELRGGIAGFDAGAIRSRCAARFGEPALLGKLESVYARVTAGRGYAVSAGPRRRPSSEHAARACGSLD